MIESDQERRKYNRYNFNSALEFKMAAGPQNDTFMGYTINVSAAGLCIGLYRRLVPGDQISIQRIFLPFLLGKATVQWVKEIGEDLFVAGLTVV